MLISLTALWFVFFSFFDYDLFFCSFFFFSSRRRHTRSLCDWSSTCALPILASFRLLVTSTRPVAESFEYAHPLMRRSDHVGRGGHDDVLLVGLDPERCAHGLLMNYPIT